MRSIKDKDIRTNGEIRAEQVRLLGSAGEQLGVLSAREALYKAQQEGLDLVEISPTAKPPVCRIMDFGKYRYELRRKARDARKKQKVVHLKEVKMRPKIGLHDYEFKRENIKAFLARGDKVRVVVMFFGREMAYVSHGEALLQRLIADLEGQCRVEGHPRLEGRNMLLFLLPK